MKGHEPGERAAGLAGFVCRIIEDRLFEVEILVVGEITGQHIHDEAFFDGLAHRVQVEGLVFAVFDLAEHLKGAAFGCGGEREEGQVGLRTPRCHRFCEQRFGVGRFVFAVRLNFRLGRAQGATQLSGGLTGLRGVGFVDYDRIVAFRYLFNLVEDVGELLQGRDDDPGLFTDQGFGQLCR